jgi:predicted nicotinamide N-methyase
MTAPNVILILKIAVVAVTLLLLASLVALARGLRVEFTDYDRAPLHFVDRSVRENGFDPSLYTTGLLDWRDLPDRRYPIILGSDVLYADTMHPHLRRIFRARGIGPVE